MGGVGDLNKKSTHKCGNDLKEKNKKERKTCKETTGNLHYASVWLLELTQIPGGISQQRRLRFNRLHLQYKNRNCVRGCEFTYICVETGGNQWRYNFS
jgi:hypothetical protein